MAKKGTKRVAIVEEDTVGELGDNGVTTEDAAAHVEATGSTGQQGDTEPAAKKRSAYYMVMSMSRYGTADAVLGTFRSQRAAEKWLIANRVLISKVAETVVLIRARNVQPRI